MSLSRTLFVCVAVIAAGPVTADDKPKPHALTPKEIADGWLMLFDGETTFGWKIDGTAEVKNGELVLGGGKPTVAALSTIFGAYDLRMETDGDATLAFRRGDGQARIELKSRSAVVNLSVRIDPAGARIETKLTTGPDKVVRYDAALVTTGPTELRVEVPASDALRVKSVKLKPFGTKPLFDGKTLDGWKVFAGDPKRTATKFEVTKDGELSAKNGPGDIQTVGQYADFVLQLECKTNGKALNSGVFFRCIPDQYQNGYEAQIQNAYAGDDRTKPLDFGTGAIYRRVPARKVVSNDDEWFSLTLVAHGPHIATWVNGYQAVDWTDDRKASDNPRQGLKTGKGHLSIQGHDPTTDLLFRNIRLAENLTAGANKKE